MELALLILTIKQHPLLNPLLLKIMLRSEITITTPATGVDDRITITEDQITTIIIILQLEEEDRMIKTLEEENV
jgi:hypothetical protein